MRIISLHDRAGLAMSAGDDALYTQRNRVADATTWMVFVNITRPEKWPIANDTIALRDLRTNRLLALDTTLREGEFVTAESLRLTALQTDYKAERFTALLTVRGTSVLADGTLQWSLSTHDRAGMIDVEVQDHSVGTRLRHAGLGVQMGGTSSLHVGRERGEVITFHAVRPDDLGDLRSSQEVWISIDGRPVIIGADRALTVVADAPRSVQPWTAHRFRVETIDRQGILTPGTRLRLRPVDRGRFPDGRSVVVVQDGNLVISEDGADVFEYEPLVDLAGYWNPEVQDNAIFVDAAPTEYAMVRSEGRVFARPRPGMVPMKQFFSPSRGDTLTTATVVGQETALAGDYTYRGVVGWAYDRPQPFTRVARQYWHGGRGDSMLTATEIGEGSCHAYRFEYEDCFVLPPASAITAAPSLDSTRPRTPPTIPNVDRPQIVPGVVTPPHSGGIVPGVSIDPALRNDLVGRGLGVPPLVAERIRAGVRPRRPVRALVLSGGGAKGAFEAGAIQALWEDGYRPDIVCGVSVGAINAVKIAENRPESANNLVDLWRTFSADPHAVFLDSLYLKLMERTLQEVTDTTRDAGIMALVAKALLPGPLFMDDLAGLGAGLTIVETSDLSDHLRRLLNLAVMSHSMHSMEPLRRAIAREVRPDVIARNGMRMRLGINDAKTGCYFSVTEPFVAEREDDFDTLLRYGLVELEPDMAEGGNWLTQPIYNCQRYAMQIVDAVYASSIMPVFMEPLEVQLARTELRDISGLGRVGMLSARLPDELRAIVDAAAPGGIPATTRTQIEERYAAVMAAVDRYSTQQGLPADATERSRELRRRTRAVADGQRGTTSAERLLFDGGLVDAIPIRTAIRMGATEILVIGVDQLHAGGGRFLNSSPITQFNLFGGAGLTGGIDPMTLPLTQYLFSTLGGLVHGTTRMDLLSSLGIADARRIGQAATEQMSEAERTQLADTLRKRSTAATRKPLLGATTSLGGWSDDAYGNLSSAGLAIDVILPDRQLLDSLAFADRPGVDEAIELGRIASRNPIAV